MLAEHLQRMRQQASLHILAMDGHVLVDQRIEAAPAVQAERADPDVPGDAATPRRQERHHRSQHDGCSQGRDHAQRIALDQPLDQMAAGIAIVKRVVEVEDDNRRIGTRRRIRSVRHVAKNS